MSYFDNNMKILQGKFPNVSLMLQELQANKETSDSFSTESGEFDAAWMDAVEGAIGDIKLIFVYGFGQGIGLSDIIEKYPERLIIVYEPDEYSFLHAVHQYDLTPVLEWPKIIWFSLGEDQLNMLFYNICTYMDGELAFVALRQYLNDSFDSLKEVKSKFLEYQFTFESNRLTMNFFGEDWVRNPLNQLHVTVNHPSVIELNLPYQGATAVIVASGPSLNGDIEWLKKMKDHALIISAGSNIQALLNYGVTPHLTTILDGSPINEKVFSVPGALQPPLLFSLSAYYGISDMKKENMIYAVFQNDLVSRYVLDLDASYPYFYSTPTVSGTAIQAAISLGAKRIVFMGQDLSIQNGQFYASGVKHADQNELENQVQNARLKVKNVFGEENDTTPSFKLMKDSLESVISVFSDVEFLNATRGGARIEGAKWMDPERVYELIKEESIPEDAVLKALRELSEKSKNTQAQKVGTLESRITLLTEELLIVKGTLFDIKKKVGKIRELARTKPKKAWDVLANIELAWRDIVNRPWFEAVFLTLNPKSIHDFDRLLPIASLEQDICKKADLIHEHLGSLVSLMSDEIPRVIEMIEESTNRIKNETNNLPQ
ncbi:6-hydroxymethylpterin diphosphokinase MptE-like protein [Paenibacillus taichungensis]